MPKQPRRVPRYRHYKPKNLGVVRIDGKDQYLGRYDSPESREKYHRLIAEWLSNGGAYTTPAVASALAVMMFVLTPEQI